MNRKTLQHSFLATLPVMAGYLVLGMGFGILLYDKGYDFWWAIFMSVGIYAGSMQYVGIELMAAGSGLLPAALMTLMVNARHLFYGVSMVDKYRDMGKAKPYLIYSLTDETYSLVCDAVLPEGVDRKGYYVLVSLLNQGYWVLGSFLGGILGSALAINTAGLDFAMTALFVVIAVEQWEKAKTHVPAILGFGVSGVCLLLFGPSNFLIPAMLGISVLLLVLRPMVEKKEAEQ